MQRYVFFLRIVSADDVNLQCKNKGSVFLVTLGFPIEFTSSH